ncbi:titin homolog isoform X2 [Ischnura elegans]|uniref:titin homolog isoform X2 n=1 Tax=Ischnura elegans TaxID=197161 RepID=UPI001ED86BAC|nr:titin homolog isoform X2 [Ischnura elegans]
MNKLKMAAVQERLKLKRVQIDTWTTREKLCLASAVLRSGDQNWVSVSRTLRGFDELNRPPDWFSQKNCALQYSSLLEKVDTPKRKRGERGEVHVETPGECIVRKLTSERVEELKKSIEFKKALHHKLRREITLVQSGQADDRLDEMLQEIEEEKLQKKREAERQAQWLKEREEKLLEIKRAWKPPATTSAHHKQRESEGGQRRNSSQSEPSSEGESLEDSPLSSEPLQVDVIGDESLEGQGDAKPPSPLRESSPQPTPALLPCTTSAPATPTPTSPLLTSLLKSPSQAPSLQASSILHSAITAQRGSSPTITSLLNSSPGIPVSSAASPSVSAGIKNLVTSAISGASTDDHTEKAPQPVAATTSPSAGAPTLSMLLELPPSQPGKPLPEIPNISTKSLPSTPVKEIPTLSPPHSSPPSPQPAQGSEASQPSLPRLEEGRVEEARKEEELSKEEEVTKQPEKGPKVDEDKAEVIEDKEESKVIESEDLRTEKPELELSVPEVVPEVPAAIEEPPSDIVSQVSNPSDAQESVVETSVSEIAEATEKDAETKAQGDEHLSNNDSGQSLSSLPDPPPTESTDCVEDAAEINAEAAEEAVKEEKVVVTPEPETEEITVETEETTNQKELHAEIKSADTEISVNKEAAAEIPEKMVDQGENESSEGKPMIESESTSVPEAETKLAEQVRPPSPAADVVKMITEEASVAGSEDVCIKKEEDIPGPTVDEDNSESRGILEESLLSTPESSSPDPQVKRKGGSRGRRSRMRGLSLIRYHQERLAKEKLGKEKEGTATSEGDVDSGSKEKLTPTVPAAAEEVVTEKTEINKVSEGEVSNLSREKNEDLIGNVIDDDKKVISTSLRRGKVKKAEEVLSLDSEAKSSALQHTRSSASEDDTPKEAAQIVEDVEGKRKVPVKDTSDPSEKSQEEKSKEEEKPSVSVQVEAKPVEKVADKKKREEPLPVEEPEPKKISAERKSDERRNVEKKADSKVKQDPVDKKAEVERRRSKDAKQAERRERRSEDERRGEREESAGREGMTKGGREEERRSLGKERRSEGKERRSTSDKGSEERKPSRERRGDGDEKSESEKVSSDARVKGDKDEREARKGDGEKKVRERKSEDRERRVVSERKEENKRKLAEEKKAEERKAEERKAEERKAEERKAEERRAEERRAEERKAEEKKAEDVDESKTPKKEAMATPTKRISGASTPEKPRTPRARSPLVSTVGERSKRKLEVMEEDDSSLDDSVHPPDAKQAKLLEEPAVGKTEEPEKDDAEKKSTEDVTVKRKVDRRKGTQNKRVDPDEAVARSSVLQIEEKSNDGEVTPKPSQGRRKGTVSTSISSAPATPLDQIPHSPASSGSISEEERDYRAWKKAILLVWSRLATHKFASIFLRPITNEQAPGYHNVVYRPVDLYTIKKNVENGVIRTTQHFQRDVMLMFLNAIMYNSSDHDVHRMSLQMQEESLQHIQILLEASEAPKILRRETREANKRSDSSSVVQSASTPSQDDSSTGVSSSAIAAAATPVDNSRMNFSEEEMSECDYPLSYSLSATKGNLSGRLSRVTESECLSESSQKDDSAEPYNKKFEQEENSHQLSNNGKVRERHSSGENSNAELSDDEDDKGDTISSHRVSKTAEIRRKKEMKQSSMSSSHLNQYPDGDLGDEQLSSSQFGDNDLCGSEVEKKSGSGTKRPLNECSMSSEDSCSIPDDGGDWSNVMSMRGEKGDDSESVSSIFNKRRRVQRKSTNSDPESLLDAPTFPFSSNFASLEENDYQAWKKFVLMIWDQLADHEFATIFMTPVRTDEAPRYYNVVFRPMDLGTIRKNVEKGVVRTIAHFQRDVMLMLTNAIMYNPSHHEVHRRTAQMQNECAQFLQMLVAESSEDPEVFRHEIRESNNKVRSTGIEELTAAFPPGSPSVEEQFSNIPTSGNLFSASPQQSSFNGAVGALNEETDVRTDAGKSTGISERTLKFFSKKRRISTLE